MSKNQLETLLSVNNLEAIALYMARKLGGGLRGRQAEIVHLLRVEGVSETKAVQIAADLAAAGYAAHPPGLEWMRTLPQEYPEFVGPTLDRPRQEALEEVAQRLALSESVAKEILEGLEAGGFPDPAATPEHQREKVRRLLEPGG